MHGIVLFAYSYFLRNFWQNKSKALLIKKIIWPFQSHYYNKRNIQKNFSVFIRYRINRKYIPTRIKHTRKSSKKSSKPQPRHLYFSHSIPNTLSYLEKISYHPPFSLHQPHIHLPTAISSNPLNSYLCSHI